MTETFEYRHRSQDCKYGPVVDFAGGMRCRRCGKEWDAAHVLAVHKVHIAWHMLRKSLRSELEVSQVEFVNNAALAP